MAWVGFRLRAGAEALVRSLIINTAEAAAATIRAMERTERNISLLRPGRVGGWEVEVASSGKLDLLNELPGSEGRSLP